MRTIILSVMIFVSISLTSFAFDGEVDSTFKFDTNIFKLFTKPSIRKILPQADGKILCVIEEYYYSYTLLRLTSDGRLDVGYNRRKLFSPRVELQSNGKAIALVKDSLNVSLERLNDDGSIDADFKKNIGNNLRYFSPLFKVAPNDNIIFTTTIRGQIADTNLLIKISKDGMVSDTYYYRFPSLPGSINGNDITQIAVQSNGRIYFQVIQSYMVYDQSNHIPRYYSNYFVDVLSSNFTRNPFINPPHDRFDNIMVLPNDYLMVTGNFKTLWDANEIADRNGIARLSDYGVLDLSFNRPRGTIRGVEEGTIYGITQQPDGKFIIVGSFKWYNGVNTPGIVRTDENGNVDYSFHLGMGVDSIITSVGLMPDGNIIIAGNFTSYNGAPTKYMAKIKTGAPPIQPIETELSGLHIYPNPATDICTISNVPAGSSVRIMNTSGALALSFLPSSRTETRTFDTKALASGLYYVWIGDDNGQMFSLILTIEH